MAPTTYAEVLARNIRAARTRKRLGQTTVVERMRALGFTSWHRPTLGNVERGERRVTAEEIFGLSEALETSIGALMTPVEDDKVVEFPSDAAVTVEHVRLSVRGQNDGAVQWNGDSPVFPPPLSTARQLAAAGIADWTRDGQEFDRATGEFGDDDDQA